MTLFTQLDAEWQWLPTSAHAAAELKAWAAQDPTLRRFADLGALVRFAQAPGHPVESDELLLCLARRTRDNSLAARALLQAVLYGLIKIAADFKAGTDSDEEAASIVVAAAYDRIRTYPVRKRPRRIAANILLDTRQAVSRALFRPRVHQLLVDDLAPLLSESPGPSATEELLALVEEAVRAHLIKTDDARLIVLTRVADVPVNTIADARGCLAQSLRQRRLRAEASLAGAALAEAVA
jgi:hypothetical protein